MLMTLLLIIILCSFGFRFENSILLELLNLDHNVSDERKKYFASQLI